MQIVIDYSLAIFLYSVFGTGVATITLLSSSNNLRSRQYILCGALLALVWPLILLGWVLLMIGSFLKEMAVTLWRNEPVRGG